MLISDIKSDFILRKFLSQVMLVMANSYLSVKQTNRT